MTDSSRTVSPGAISSVSLLLLSGSKCSENGFFKLMFGKQLSFNKLVKLPCVLRTRIVWHISYRLIVLTVLNYYNYHGM